MAGQSPAAQALTVSRSPVSHAGKEALPFLLAALAFGGPLHAQADSAMAWVREAPRRATLLAGCYALGAPIHDSVAVPATLRLTDIRVRALGYHRPAHFWTDLPQSNHAEIRPIWTPKSDDSLEIDLDPHASGLPRFLVVARVRGDSLQGAYQHRYWVLDTTVALGLRLERTRSIAVHGQRIPCTQPDSSVPPNKRMDQPSADAFKGSRMTERLALIRVRSPRRTPGELIARRSCADR